MVSFSMDTSLCVNDLKTGEITDRDSDESYDSIPTRMFRKINDTIKFVCGKWLVKTTTVAIFIALF